MHSTPPVYLSDEQIASYPAIGLTDQISVSLRIGMALRVRSGRSWRVRRGAPETYGALRIISPADRLTEHGEMTDEDRVELTRLLGLDTLIPPDGVRITDSHDHYAAYIDRAEGRVPRVIPQEDPWE